MATYAIGDIQGCHDALRRLLAAMGFEEGTDTLWLVGDLINRGPDNLATLQYLMQLKHVVSILGNHDLHFLAVATGVRAPSRSDTLDDLLAAPRLERLVEWLRRRPLVHMDKRLGFMMIHAGQPPIWDAATCVAMSREVEEVLRGKGYVRFLENMYGNQPNRFSGKLKGYDRLRAITNYFTRMRFCKADGELEFSAKSTDAPKGFRPWFDFPRAGDDKDKPRVLFGHWAALDGETGNPNAIALDTGCVWGRTLTGLRLEDGKQFSVPATRP